MRLEWLDEQYCRNKQKELEVQIEQATSETAKNTLLGKREAYTQIKWSVGNAVFDIERYITKLQQELPTDKNSSAYQIKQATINELQAILNKEV